MVGTVAEQRARSLAWPAALPAHRRYLLVRETDIAASKDSWQALKGFGEV